MTLGNFIPENSRFYIPPSEPSVQEQAEAALPGCTPKEGRGDRFALEDIILTKDARGWYAALTTPRSDIEGDYASTAKDALDSLHTILEAFRTSVQCGLSTIEGRA